MWGEIHPIRGLSTTSKVVIVDYQPLTTNRSKIPLGASRKLVYMEQLIECTDEAGQSMVTQRGGRVLARELTSSTNGSAPALSSTWRQAAEPYSADLWIGSRQSACRRSVRLYQRTGEEFA